MGSIQKVKLTNGYVTLWSRVQRRFFGLQTLHKTNLAALYELYQACAEPRTVRHFVELLVSLGFTDGSRDVDEETKNVVLCSVKIEGLTIQLVSPVKEGPYTVQY